MDIPTLDKILESAVLLRASEASHARGYRHGSAFGSAEDAQRLEAFSLGILAALAQSLAHDPDRLPLLAYMTQLIEHGPGSEARAATDRLLELDQSEAMRPYVAGGRRLVLRMLTGKTVAPGLFAELLEEELRRPESR